MTTHSPPVTFSVRAERALFTRPELRVERFTYPLPTYGALAGVLRSIYAKPSFFWVPTRVLIMKPIRYQNIMINEVKTTAITKRPFVAPERRMQKMQTYLYDVHYLVEAHFKWSENQPEDRDLTKHLCIFERSLDTGGRRDVFLGMRECTAIVEPLSKEILKKPAKERFDAFMEIWNKDHQGFNLNAGYMFHGWEWGTGTAGSDIPTFFNAQVIDSVLEYPRPDDYDKVIRQNFGRREAQ
ncbi:MAG: type I-C CRISPR-associated protein Cas5 [Phycisphaerae bacterium]|nr:type I-C CRISPR-associated protein Cas5 [Phycisphaerae bacterium]